MADVTISYNGEDIATMSASGTKTLPTDGKRCVDDITVVYDKPSAPSVTVEALNVTENDTYTAPSGKAYSPVTVAVPQKTEESLSATENRTYTPSAGHVYNSVSVNVPTQEATLKALIDRSITSITIPSGVTTIGGWAFSRCTSLTSCVIPPTVTEIGQSAFEECTGLLSMVLPDSITAIRREGFYGCTALKELTIGASVSTLEYACCKNLTACEKLTFRRATPAYVSTSQFQNLNPACVIHVPAGSLNAYKTAANYPDPNTYTYVEDSAS